jgi:hypothetical protein
MKIVFVQLTEFFAGASICLATDSVVSFSRSSAWEEIESRFLC